MNRLLYYPYISIPNKNWLIQALLYWDGIATIVPKEELEKQICMTPFARNLVNDNIIETVQPEEYAFYSPELFNDFLEWALNNRQQFLLGSENIANRFSKTAKLHSMHAAKLGYFCRDLERAGIAKKIDKQWYLVNEEFSFFFMTFLAILIGEHTDRIPATDAYLGLSYLFNVDPPTQNADLRNIRNRFRRRILDEVLPVPTYIEDYSNILRFKERHGDQLIRFRRKIERFIEDLDRYSVEIQERECSRFVEDAKEEIEEIKGEMGYFHAPRINVGTLAAATPDMIDLTRGNFFSIPQIIGRIVFNGRRDDNLKKPFAYAALFQDEYRRQF